MGNMLVQQSDPLEQVADFQKQTSRLPPLAELAEGTALAVHRDAAGVAPRTGRPGLSQSGQTPLPIATREGNTEAAALIQAGAESSRPNAQAVTWLQKEFSGELGVTAPGVTRAGASATLFLPRRDAAGRGLVEDSASGKSCYVVVQSPSRGDGRQERLYFATRRGATEPPT